MHRGFLSVAAVFMAALIRVGAAAEVQWEPVSFKTSDSVSIAAGFLKGSGQKPPAAVLVHMPEGSKEDWHGAVRDYLLEQTGMSYLAIDLRGHGESTIRGDESLHFETFSESDFQDMVKDVAAAVDYLRGRDDIDPDAIAIVGASTGANIAIKYAAGDERIKAVAMLSGALEHNGVSSPEAIGEYGRRPIFFAACREDVPAGLNINRMELRARGRKVVDIYQGNLHGTRMFGATPAAERLAGFLKRFVAEER